MVRSFGGYFGVQTAPSVWSGAPGIWSIRDIPYFQQQGQWPGAASQFAAVAFTHGPDSIGGAPYLTVYRYFPGNANSAPGGIGSKYPSPIDTVGYRNFGLAFSPDNNTIAAGAGNYNYYNFYRWSDSGFGTRYNSPGDTGNSIIMDIHFNSSSNCVALAVSSFGNTTTTPSTTPSLFVYKWDATNGFGTKYADPVNMSYIPESQFFPNTSVASYTANTYPGLQRVMIRGVGAVVFSNDGQALIHSNGEHNPSAYVYDFEPNSGFGTLKTGPRPLAQATASSATMIKYTIYNTLQLSYDDKVLVSGMTGTNISTAAIAISVGYMGTLASFNATGARTFSATAFPTNIDTFAGGDSNLFTAQSRIGSRTNQITRGTNATTSNTSIIGTRYNNTAIPSYGIRVASLGNTHLSTGTASLSTDTPTSISDGLYGTGIDVTPNGREVIYTDAGGVLRNYYAPLNVPLNSTLTALTVTAIGLPSAAHKVRFNNFDQQSNQP
jgi:hypothetical protein